jgi:hypothetical protein
MSCPCLIFVSPDSFLSCSLSIMPTHENVVVDREWPGISTCEISIGNVACSSMPKVHELEQQLTIRDKSTSNVDLMFETLYVEFTKNTVLAC